MDTMTLVHEQDGQAFTLAAERRPRRLFVLQGRAWVTEKVGPAHAEPVADLWLGAGAVLELPAGSAWVVQAEGDLRLALREAALPGLRPRTALFSAGRRFARWLRAGLAPLPHPAR